MQAQGSGLSDSLSSMSRSSLIMDWAVHSSTVILPMYVFLYWHARRAAPSQGAGLKRIVRPAMCACPFGLHSLSSSSLTCGLACRARWGRATSSRRWEAASSASWASSWRRCTAWSPTTSAASSPTPSTGLQTPLHVSQSLDARSKALTSVYVHQPWARPLCTLSLLHMQAAILLSR